MESVAPGRQAYLREPERIYKRFYRNSTRGCVLLWEVPGHSAGHCCCGMCALRTRRLHRGLSGSRPRVVPVV